MKYRVFYTIQLGRVVIVDAETSEEAKENVLEAVGNGTLYLDSYEDYIEDSEAIEECVEADSYDVNNFCELDCYEQE